MRLRCVQTEDRERGAVLPLVALSLAFLMTMTAFTIDLGRVMLTNRDLQKVTDLVSLDLARRLDGRTVDQINADSNFNQQMLTSASRNGFDIAGDRTIAYELGAVDTTTRQFHQLHGSSIPNAVRVLAGDNVHFFFAPGSQDASKAAAALGTGTPLCLPTDPACTPCPPGDPACTPCPPGDPACTPCPPAPGFCPMTAATSDLQLGSFLGSVDSTQAQMLNALLSNVGTGVSLTAVSYQGLGNSQLTMRQLATQLGLATPTDIFTSTVSYKTFLLASAQALSANGAPAAAVTALQTFAQTVPSGTTIPISGLILNGQVNQGTGASALDSYVKFLNLLEASAFLVNGNNGPPPAGSAITIPNLSLGLPGITSVTGSLKVVESPRTKLFMHVGDSLSTSQADLTLTIGVDRTIAGQRLQGTIVVHPTSASARATPALIACPGNSGPVTPQVQVGVVSVPVTTTGNEALTLSSLGIPVLSVNVASTSITSGGSSASAQFLYATEFLPSVGSGGMKRVANPALNLASGFTATSANASVIGVPLTPLSALVSNANSILNSTVFPAIQDTIVPLITSTFGVELGGADVGAMDLHCVGPALIR